ncbi:hypothetical protein WG68_00090 [Arsukibacterium ikkense]|uniref:HTH cro/C1-type domain-containing protein n=1 Tax=Arsukibacterium ikkense TaxID=336831 RepID=A0A0M2V902_9GAMM|nr:RodZ domain-containing protein [Arsukibacterium ikkense]KKO47096.1 hypothetical protein WG68_00090 [Arsukibacterium ikkense]
MSNVEDTPLTAGQLLRQAREQRKLTVADVALQLNLRLNLVNQIETDQLDSSLLVTFVRGYLKAYARLVKLPEQQVLAAFEQQSGGSTGPAKPMRTFSNRAELQATENRFMWLTYAIGFILVLMLVLWWWQTASPSAENSQVQQQALNAPGQAENSNLAEQAEATNSEPDNSSLPVTPSLDAVPDFDTADAVPELASTVAPQLDVINMEFKDNCWIDVLDAAGNRIAFGTKQKGYKMTVSGIAPFVVTLGNPSVVRVTLNNQPFDMSSLPAGRVAKFTLAEPD